MGDVLLIEQRVGGPARGELHLGFGEVVLLALAQDALRPNKP
ncbi:hypothetical protein ACFXA3_06715 [Streptomyces sp. NPDC059456]